MTRPGPSVRMSVRPGELTRSVEPPAPFGRPFWRLVAAVVLCGVYVLGATLWPNLGEQASASVLPPMPRPSSWHVPPLEMTCCRPIPGAPAPSSWTATPLRPVVRGGRS